ncbi:MAG: cytochrome C oxidase subunit IV family protein [Thermoguttaceae bacterium]
MREAANPSSHVEHPIAHVMPVPVLLGVFAALMTLTFLTVAATWVNLGWLNLPVAMAIATVKATLVALYFMHLRYDAPFNGLAFLSALGFVALFIVVTLLDTFHYQPDIQQYRDRPGASVPSGPE